VSSAPKNTIGHRQGQGADEAAEVVVADAVVTGPGKSRPGPFLFLQSDRSDKPRSDQRGQSAPWSEVGGPPLARSAALTFTTAPRTSEEKQVGHSGGMMRTLTLALVVVGAPALIALGFGVSTGPGAVDADLTRQLQ
jgi:hypothetical protein